MFNYVDYDKFKADAKKLYDKASDASYLKGASDVIDIAISNGVLDNRIDRLKEWCREQIQFYQDQLDAQQNPADEQRGILIGSLMTYKQILEDIEGMKVYGKG